MDDITRNGILAGFILAAVQFLKKALPRAVPWLDDEMVSSLAAGGAIVLGLIANVAVELLAANPPDWRRAALAGIVTGAVTAGGFKAVKGAVQELPGAMMKRGD